MIAQSLPTNPPTLQEIFDTVVAHLREQGVACKNSDNCVYRNSAHQACAVGCLIPDSIYRPALEENGVIRLYQWNYLPEFFAAYGITTEDTTALELMADLQCTHDTNNPINWELSFSSLATNYSLTYEPR